MHNRDKYPSIWAEKEKAEAELAKLMAKRKVHTDQIGIVNKSNKSAAEVEKEKNRLNDLAMADYPRIAELRKDIARLAMAMGAKIASGT